MNKKIVILLFLFLPLFFYGKFGRDTKQLSFYYGQTYRFNTNFYSSFDISYEYFRSTCTYARFKGFGLRLANFKNNNFSISVKGFRSFLNRPDLTFATYWSLSPVYFEFNNISGLNIKPELAIRFNTYKLIPIRTLSISLNISYGYDIPIINEKVFCTNRHDISVKLALTINLSNYHLKYFRKKNNKSETKPTNENE